MPAMIQRPTSCLLPLALVLLAACGSDGSPAAGPTEPTDPPAPPPPSSASVQFDFDHIEVVQDCDGGLDGDGEFVFRVSVSVSSGGGGTVYNSSRTMGNGDRTPAIGRRTYTVPNTDGQSVSVRFVASETDRNILGQTFNDDRLSNAERVAQHTYNGGRWAGAGPRSLTLGPSDCQVRLRYTVNPL